MYFPTSWRLIGILGLAHVVSFSAAFRPPPIAEELGCSPTLSLFFGTSTRPYFFDPLGFSDDVNFPRLREAELKHGRVAMLAVTATLVVPFLKQGAALPKEYPSGILHCVDGLTWTDAARVVATCGLLETLVMVPREAQAMPGDYGTGYFGIRDKGWNELSLVSELENGRLGMLAFVAQLVVEEVTGGKSWDEQWLVVFKAWIREALQL
jgi:hypothetical protein